MQSEQPLLHVGHEVRRIVPESQRMRRGLVPYFHERRTRDTIDPSLLGEERQSIVSQQQRTSPQERSGHGGFSPPARTEEGHRPVRGNNRARMKARAAELVPDKG